MINLLLYINQDENERITHNFIVKMNFSVITFFGKCKQIRSFVRICLHILKKFLRLNFIFYAMFNFYGNRLITEIHWQLTLNKNLIFPLKISSVIVIKSAVSGGFGQTY